MASDTDYEKTPKTEAERVKFWLDRVATAKNELEDWARTSGADRFVDEYNGKWTLFFQGLRGRIPVPPINEVFAFCQTNLANIYNRDPYISVNPKAGSVRSAKIWEIILNYDWRHLRVKEQVEPEMIDKDLVGYGFHKVGVAFESMGTGDQVKIASEKFYSMRVNWRDMVWNIGSKRPPDDCIWMAQRITRPINEIKKKYKAAAKMQGVQSPDCSKLSYDNAMYKDDIQVGVLWEVWDAETKTFFLIGESVDEKYLEAPKPWPPYLDVFPFQMYWDFESAGKPRPMSAIAPWEQQILAKMTLMASALNHAKRWNRQMIVNQGAIDEASLDKFERGDDGAIIVNNGTGNLNENVKFMDYGPLPTDFYMLYDRLSIIEREINGQTEADRGGLTKTSSRTLGELQIAQEGSKGRTDRKIDRFETHLENIARLMLNQRKANFDMEEVVKITGKPPQEVIDAVQDIYDPVTHSIRVTPEDIQGEFDVEVKAGSTLPLNKATKMKILELVMQNLAAASSAGVSPMMNTVVTEILDGFDIKALSEAWEEEKEAAQERSRMAGAETFATSQKAQTQAEKNQAQAEKIRTDTDLEFATTIKELMMPNGKEESDEMPGM